MTSDILWLVRLGTDQRLMTLKQCDTILKSLGAKPDLMDFAQRLIDDGYVTDIDKLESLAGLALEKSTAGESIDDPFATKTPSSPPVTGFAQTRPPFSLTRPPFASPEGQAIQFEKIEFMDDHALARGMRELLKAMGKAGASDLHLSAGSKPFIRKHRAIQNISEHVLTARESQRLNTVLLSDAQKQIFAQKQDYDFALALDLANRYRVNLMVHKWGPAGAYRMVPSHIRSLEELGFKTHMPTIEKLLSYHNGLILVTGPVGSGKTTTLASMVSWLNETREDHIITVEDPIEVVQTAKRCNVTQREVGEHTASFFSALKGALREDPDVIVIGELRDLETIEMAITAGETGHLVIGTMHTSDAGTTLNRLLDVFPPSQQSQIRTSVAESLRGIICQRLLPSTDGKLALACEVLVNNTAISNLIREGKSAGLRNTMETGVRDGMCLMDNAIFNLWQQGVISPTTAATNIINRTIRARIS